jgi:hypothetical protein
MSPLARFENADWTRVPPRLHHELERYLVDGIRPQSLFLARVLANDLAGAIVQASRTQRAGLVDLVLFLEDDCPFESYGGRDHYEHWIALGGWRGMRDECERFTFEPTLPPAKHAWRGKLWKPGRNEDDD